MGGTDRSLCKVIDKLHSSGLRVGRHRKLLQKDAFFYLLSSLLRIFSQLMRVALLSNRDKLARNNNTITHALTRPKDYRPKSPAPMQQVGCV